MSKDYSLKNQPAERIRRREYACDDDWNRDFINNATVGYVATRWDEQPFITPLTFWYDPEGHKIYFHTNPLGRLHANSKRHPQVCFAASRWGDLLPSNIALEFSIQYESLAAFGKIHLIEDEDEKRRALYGLIEKYFPEMTPGEQYRPIMDQEIRRTAVYAISITSWSGKRNWPARAEQSDDWPPLAEE